MALSNFENSRVRGKRVIYTASSFAKQNLIYLQEIGRSEYLEPYTSQRENLSSFLFFIVEKGSGNLVYNNLKYNLSVGSCVLINCNCDYSISSKQDLWILSWIHFNGPTMKVIYQKFLERCGGPCFISSKIDDFIAQHKQLLIISNQDSYVKDMRLMTALSSLLTMIMEQCWSDSRENAGLGTQRKWTLIRQYLEENYLSNIRLDEMSEKFSMNKFYITRKFREEYGCTINQFVTRLRITHAKELLRFSELNITEIANNSGFCDSAYFTRVFTKEEGISPTVFRKQWKNISKV